MDCDIKFIIFILLLILGAVLTSLIVLGSQGLNQEKALEESSKVRQLEKESYKNCRRQAEKECDEYAALQGIF